MGVLAKGIGIFVVIVIIAIAVSWIGNPQNESQNESQNELQNEKLNDNIIQVRVATIPSYADKEMVADSIKDALSYRWTKYNPEITFEYTTDQYNELFIHWEKAPKEHIGFQEGKSIMIGLGQYDCKGKWQHYSKETLSDIAAHETGHYLGLEHHKDKGHLMYGDDEFTRDPFDTLGYNIPPHLTKYTSYVESEKAEQRLDEQAAKTQAMYKALGFDKTGTIVAGTPGVIKLHEEYNDMVREHNKLVSTVNCFYEHKQTTSESSSLYNHCKNLTFPRGSIGTYVYVSPIHAIDGTLIGADEKIWCSNPDFRLTIP